MHLVPSPDDWISLLSRNMTLELVKLIDAQRAEHGSVTAQQLTAQFIAAFTAATVVRALGCTRANAIPNQRVFDEATLNLERHTSLVQQAVAAGFSGALKEFTGQPVEYYCQLKLVPPPLSQTLN